MSHYILLKLRRLRPHTQILPSSTLLGICLILSFPIPIKLIPSLRTILHGPYPRVRHNGLELPLFHLLPGFDVLEDVIVVYCFLDALAG